MNASPTHDITAGSPRIREKYQGTDETFRKMARKIREAARDPASLPAFQQFAEAIVRKAGYGPNDRSLTHERAAQLFLDHIRANVRYRPDPPMVEFVKGAAITLCVPGAAACIPVADCDDVTVAFCALCMAYGIEARVTVQDFGPDADLHVIATIKDSRGNWQPADPSHPNAPVGRKLLAEKEWHYDPLEPESIGLKDAHEAEFVSVGSLPDDANGVARRLVGAAPDGDWSVVTPASDGSTPVSPGIRYRVICTTPTEKPGAGAQVVFLPPPFPPVIWPGTGTGTWTSADTTTLFQSAGWLVETATSGGSPGAWTVVGIPTAAQNLQSSSQVTYVQVLAQAGPGAQPATPPNTMPAAGPSVTKTGAVVIGVVAVAALTGGVFAALRYRENGWGAPAHRRLSAREAGRKLSKSASGGMHAARSMGRTR